MENRETPCFIPVIARMDGLDRQIQILEEKRSFSRSDFCAFEGENECKTLSLALEEVQHKGTLMERLAILEKRVLELSLEIEEGNTSRSSCSTVQGKQDSIDKRKDEKGEAIATKQMEDPSTIQERERAVPADEKPSHRSRGQKKKPQKKWPWLFLHTC